MIHGSVTPEREAVIPLVVRGSTDREIAVEVVIDTGFTDFLTLPPALVTALDLPFAATTLATLADGSSVVLEYYNATVVWDGAPREILVLAVESGPLVGMAMLLGYALYIEVEDGRAVTITNRT